MIPDGCHAHKPSLERADTSDITCCHLLRHLDTPGGPHRHPKAQALEPEPGKHQHQQRWVQAEQDVGAPNGAPVAAHGAHTRAVRKVWEEAQDEGQDVRREARPRRTAMAVSSFDLLRGVSSNASADLVTLASKHHRRYDRRERTHNAGDEGAHRMCPRRNPSPPMTRAAAGFLGSTSMQAFCRTHCLLDRHRQPVTAQTMGDANM